MALAGRQELETLVDQRAIERERLRKLCDTQTGNPLSRPDPTEHVAR